MKMGFLAPFAEVEEANIEHYHHSGPFRFPCSRRTVDAFARLYAADLQALRCAKAHAELRSPWLP